MDLRRIHRVAGAVAALCLAVPAAAGAHVTRYTTAAATATSGDCSAAFPCRIDYAIEGAASGDQVDVAPGESTSTPASTRRRSTSPETRARVR